MPIIHINIGSNIDKETQVLLAVNQLKKYFLNLTISSVYESKAVGFEGDNFYNVGVNTSTDLSIESVNDLLHDIEDKQGRNRSNIKFCSRNIDLDLILYGSIIDTVHRLPRQDILKYNFVLAPLAELNPNDFHPIAQQSYGQLYQQQKSLSLLIKHPLSILGNAL